ncbi:DUF4276 family protein [Niveispirillum sp. BGYR6]|uniref:DUF4276 family protein n=1 Tax=Niveispirillum sp. BGYR6 TaxID=2971249 RepID=UPI0022B96F1A|nr:DUF4276 family protein [Niveispirillum sp. BGYR6]MDG5497275.1 DUF4276 family protein [Niveispirillum sp. BGYR6]
MAFIVPIVEGKGEVEAVPILLRRIAAEVGGWVKVNPPIRVASGSFLNREEERRKYVGLAANKAIQGRGHVLLMLDCDQEAGDRRQACPAELGPSLLAQLRVIRPDVSMFVALAHKEYESWFLAALESLAGQAGLPADVQAPNDPEAKRNAKGELGRLLGRNYGYDDELQRQFTELMSLQQARRAPSFDRLYQWVAGIVAGHSA